MAVAESGSLETCPESRPVVILAMMLATTLGDFIEYNLFAASFKRQYRNARLIAYYRRDRPFKDAILEMNPDIDEAWPQDAKDTIKAEFFDVEPGGDAAGAVDIVLTPSMMKRSRLPSFQNLARFHVPEPAEQTFRAAFVEC